MRNRCATFAAILLILLAGCNEGTTPLDPSPHAARFELWTLDDEECPCFMGIDQAGYSITVMEAAITLRENWEFENFALFLVSRDGIDQLVPYTFEGVYYVDGESIVLSSVGGGADTGELTEDRLTLSGQRTAVYLKIEP